MIAAWFAVLLAAGIAFAVGAGTLTSTVSIPGTRTAQVTERLERVLPQASGGSGSIVFETSDGSRLTEAQRSAISERAAEASRLADVATVVDPFQTEQDRAARQQELDKGRARIEDGRRQLAGGRARLEDGQTQLDAARARAEANGTLDQVAPALDAQQANLDAGRRALEDQGAQLEAGSEQIDQGARLLTLSEGIGMVSKDGTTAIVTVLFDKPQMDVTQEQKDAVIAAFGQRVDGVEASYSAELASGIPTILGVGEVIGIVVAAVVLIVMLGTLIGAGLPLLTALVGVAIGALFTLSLSSAIEMTSVTPVLGLMLGLAVGIDYSLFIINRHRRQLKQGYAIDESIGVANGTSGNAVVFAGATVLIALLALNVTGIPFLGLMGTVGALSIAIAVLIAVTLTPALLGLIGERILSRRERARLAAGGRTAVDDPSAVATVPAASGPGLRPMSTLRAVGSIVLGIGALVVIALPALELRLGLPDGSAETVESTQYQAFSTVSEKFGPGRNAPLLVVANLVGVSGRTPDVTVQSAIAEEISAQQDVVAVAPIGLSGGRTVAAFQVVPSGGPNDPSTEQLVHTLRALEPMEAPSASTSRAWPAATSTSPANWPTPCPPISGSSWACPSSSSCSSSARSSCRSSPRSASCSHTSPRSVGSWRSTNGVGSPVSSAWTTRPRSSASCPRCLPASSSGWPWTTSCSSARACGRRTPTAPPPDWPWSKGFTPAAASSPRPPSS